MCQVLLVIRFLLVISQLVYIQISACNSNNAMKSFFPNQFSHGIRAQNLGFFSFNRFGNLLLRFSSRTFFFFFTSFEAHSMAATATTTASASETQSSKQDSSNVNDPLFLDHGENLGAVLVSQPLISGENYLAQAWSVGKSLIAKNKLGFIDGSLTLSSPIVDSPSAIQAWIRANGMVGTWIINSVSLRLQASIVYRETALEIWNEKERK